MSNMADLWGDTASKTEITAGKAEFFKKSRYALFIHWGLYSVAGSRWKGKNHYGISEWLMRRLSIPAKEYALLAKDFHPEDFSAEKIVNFAKECGMKYIIITAKHHDGFAMFDSFHPFCITKSTPWKRDPMKELAQACAKENLGFGFYYSQFQDWSEINNWEQAEKQPTFEEYFNNKCLPQIRELVTNYGKLSLIWFDTPGQMTPEQSQKIVDLVQEKQSGALINSRIGNGVGDYSTLGDNEFPGRRPRGLWECIATSNDSWGYSCNDKNFRSGSELLSQLITVAARGGNYMVNIGPDAMGNIPPVCEEALLRAGKWIRKYGDTMLYDTDSSPWASARNWGDCTRKGNKAYFMVKPAAWGKMLIETGFPVKIREVKWLGGDKVLEFEQDETFIKIQLPAERKEEYFEVLEISCDENIPEAVLEENIVSGTLPVQLPAYSAKVRNVEIKRHFWAERFGEWVYQIHLTHWQKDAEAVWDLNILESGYYQVLVRYQNPDENNRVWVLENNSEKLEMWARNVKSLPGEYSDELGRYQTFPAGVMKFEKGQNFLSVHPAEYSETEMEISEILLVPFV